MSNIATRQTFRPCPGQRQDAEATSMALESICAPIAPVGANGTPGEALHVLCPPIKRPLLLQSSGSPLPNSSPATPTGTVPYANQLYIRLPRWRVACHEAGHILAAVLLKNDSASGVVLNSEMGCSFVDIADPLRSFDDALIVAAGPAAQRLADTHRPPSESPLPASVVDPAAPASQSMHAEILADIPNSPPDSVRIARWCCDACPDQPDRWPARHAWIMNEAEHLVRINTPEILDAARELFLRGIFSKRPAGPRKERP